jgi:hypothetical protein
MALADVSSAEVVTRKEMFVFTFKDLVIKARDGTVFHWAEMHGALDPALAAINAARRAAST